MAANYVVSNDDVKMSKIVATEQGRIFMSGNDGHLHEFSYSFTPPSRFSILDACRPRNKIQKLTHSYFQVCRIPIGKSIPRFCRTYDHLTDPILGTGQCRQMDIHALVRGACCVCVCKGVCTTDSLKYFHSNTYICMYFPVQI